MTPESRRKPACWRDRFILLVASACLACVAAPLSQAIAATTGAPVDKGVHWNDLKPAQQVALKPLENEWASISVPQKQKWLELSKRFPKMTTSEQSRIQERMAEWAHLTPEQRGQARLNFQEAKQLPPQDRQARWDAYQALTPEQKQQLAARAPVAASTNASAAHKAVPGAAQGDRSGREMPQAKSNIVPNPAFSAPPKAIAPTVVQAGPGATTTPITKRPVPPPHQQAGLPKIAATSELVDRATLLPQRSAQKAAPHSAVASASASSARQ